jgi:hypothetical protein
MIPSNLVEDVNDELPPIEISVESELEVDSRIEDLLLLLREGADLKNIVDSNLRWDPEIPTEWVNSVIRNCPAEKVFTASQFSNTGFLPLVEYFSTFEEYPRCRILGRCRFQTLITERERHFSSTSRFKFNAKRAKADRDQQRANTAIAGGEISSWGKAEKAVSQEDENYKPHSTAIELAAEMGYNVSSLGPKPDKGKEPEKIIDPDELARLEAERNAKNEDLLKLASGFSDRLGMGRHWDKYYGITEEDKPDIFANMSDGEDGDLGLDFF